MPDTIPQHFTTEFSTNWQLRAQQMKSRLDGYVSEDAYQGERKRYDRLFKQNSQEKTQRKAPTPITDPGNDSRWAYHKTFELANLLDADDAKNLGALVLPTGKYVQSHAAAYNRDADDVCWKAALDDVMTGEQGSTPSSLPNAQKIAHGGTGLTFAKLLQTREILDGADLDEGGQRCLIVTPEQVSNLLNEPKITSSDYVVVKALVAGEVDTFMGFKFIRNTRLRKPSGSTTRTCVAWVKDAIQRMKGSQMSTIDKRADLSYATQIYSSWTLGATRVYDEGVVQVDCTEAVAAP